MSRRVLKIRKVGGQLARRKTNEEFIKEIYELVGEEYKFLDEYKGTHRNIICKHNIRDCGYEWKISPSHFLRGNRCPKCAGNMKKTNDEFIKEVYGLVGDEYEFLEDYNGGKTKITCKHNKCGYKWMLRPSNFINNGTRCPECYNPNRNRNTEQFKEEVNKLVGDEYTVNGEYSNSQTKIEITHNFCGHKYYVRPNSFLNGNRCPRCTRPNYNRNDEQFKQEIYNLVGDEYSPIEKYEGGLIPIKLKHNICGHIWNVRPSNFLSSGTRCPECAKKILPRDRRRPTMSLHGKSTNLLEINMFSWKNTKLQWRRFYVGITSVGMNT